DVDRWYAERQGKTLVNYGISAGHAPARAQVMKDEYHGWHFSGPARTKEASAAELDQIVSLIRTGLARGAVGVGLTLFYTPAASEEEVTRVFAAAADVHRVPWYV